MVTDATIAAVVMMFILVVVLMPTLLLALANRVALARESARVIGYHDRNGFLGGHAGKIGKGA
jgi:hypothetical protein